LLDGVAFLQMIPDNTDFHLYAIMKGKKLIFVGSVRYSKRLPVKVPKNTGILLLLFFAEFDTRLVFYDEKASVL